ncbi:hypothetical protein M9434_006866 [Picochlorum sp. BPE23]|nr:hypothetical protein M9434_006866 [Picochlorum sp. BPE23]
MITRSIARRLTTGQPAKAAVSPTPSPVPDHTDVPSSPAKTRPPRTTRSNKRGRDQCSTQVAHTRVEEEVPYTRVEEEGAHTRVEEQVVYAMVELTPPTARKRQRVRRTKYDVRDEEDTRVALRLCQTKKEIGVGEAATILQSLKHDTTLVVMQAPKQEPKKGAKKRSTKRSTKGAKKGAKKGTTRASSSLSYPAQADFSMLHALAEEAYMFENDTAPDATRR